MKKILFSVIIAMVMLFTVASIALADDPTTTIVTWNGGGNVGATVNSGDSNAGVNTGGANINGTLTVVDSNNNPYSYNVDSFSSLLNASVTNGFISTGAVRVNSYAPMYGNGGQESWCNVGTDGTASVAFRSTTNFASMTDATYTYQLPGGHNVVITGATGYEIDRGITDGRGNAGSVYATGDGSATLDCMSAEASGVWNLAFGRGAGCYTDANFTAIGASGYFEATGVGNDSVTFNGLGISSGGGVLSVIANWVNNFSIGDYSLTAH